MNIYKNHTGFNILANSSFLLIASYAILFILDSFFNIILFKISQFIFLIWFLFNLYLIYNFLLKTMDFIYAKKKIHEITKYSYNNKSGLRDGFLVIIDELKYFIENNSISMVEELDIQLADFLEINYIKHKFDVSDLGFFISEIRRLIDNTLDYNNIHSIRKMLYIYYYIGRRLSEREGTNYLSKLLEMHYVTIFDLNNKLNISNEFRYSVYSRFIDSWTSWDYILKENTLKASYNFYTIILAANSIRRTIEIDRFIDVFLNIPHEVKIGYFNRDLFKTFTDVGIICNDGLLNLCIDSKFCLIKTIFESDLSLENKQKYIKAILENLNLIEGSTAILSDTETETSCDLVFSLFRILSNRLYDEYLNNILSKCKESNRVVNRMFWGDTSNYLEKITEIYAYIYDQFISKNSLPVYEINNYLDSLEKEAISTLFIEIDLYLRSLQNTDFDYDFFKEKKKNLIKKRYIQLIRSLKDIVQLKVS